MCVSAYLNPSQPLLPSPCSLCLEKWRPDALRRIQMHSILANGLLWFTRLGPQRGQRGRNLLFILEKNSLLTPRPPQGAPRSPCRADGAQDLGPHRAPLGMWLPISLSQDQGCGAGASGEGDHRAGSRAISRERGRAV